MSSPIPQALWNSRIPLIVTHPSSPTSPFITSIPRFSYLALLLPRLSAFFNTPCSSFHFEDVQLRNLAVGLLVDLYQPSLPWRLTVEDGVGWDISDTFLNCAKEVSFLSAFVSESRFVYSAMMDGCWSRRVDDWIKLIVSLRLISSRPTSSATETQPKS
jgi:hypothetical protein